MRTIGFIGLGNMGLPMALNLSKAGHGVRGFDASADALRHARAEGLTVCRSVAGAVEDASAIVLMLPDGLVVMDVLDAIFATANEGTLVIDCSTIDAAHARQAHDKAREAGLTFLDAPVSGGVGGAAAGALTIMVGGEASVLESAREILDLLAFRVVHCGDAGAGQAVKVCNNLLLAASMIATGEAFSLGEKLGIDPAVLYDVMSTSSGACWSITSYCPVSGIGPSSPADKDFKPGFPAELMQKDLSLGMSAAESVRQSTPMGSRALELYQRFVSGGGEGKDFSAIIEFLRAAQR